MKIVVVGPGAIGCLLAAHLSNGNEIWLFDYKPQRARLIQKQGLALEDGSRELYRNIRVVSDPEMIKEPAELILLCVKSNSVREALRKAQVLANKDSLIIAFQNGIGHLPALSELPKEIDRALGVTSQGATLAGPGHVLHKGRGLTRIGLFPQLSPQQSHAGKKLAAAADILTKTGIETEPVDDILKYVWQKLLINAGINALTAIHNCPNGFLLDDPDAVAIMKSAILEGKEVADKSGIFIEHDPVAAAVEVCKATAANISSMLQDVRSGRKTEIDAINGALLRKGEELGIPMPVNRELVRKIKKIEGGYGDFA